MAPPSTRSCNLNPFTALLGASWLYPLKGIVFFVTHRAFWPLFKTRLIPIVLLSTFILVILFTFTFLPQAAFLYIFHGPTAFLNATFLVLGEGAAIIALLFEAFFVDETLVDVFDAVLVHQGLSELVSRARVVDTTAENSVKALGKPLISSVYSPFSIRQIVEFVILLPLNLVPWIGVPLFLILTGYRAGPFQHWRYFKLMGLNRKERRQYIKRRQLKYTWFGTMALLLQLVPVLSMFFLLTSAAGSALWVAKMEQSRALQVTDTIEPPERYEDDPV